LVFAESYAALLSIEKLVAFKEVFVGLYLVLGYYISLWSTDTKSFDESVYNRQFVDFVE
jgi:hypothetical protein